MTSPTDQEITRAMALGSLAAKAGIPLSRNPYPTDKRVLRARWALAHAGKSAELLDPAHPGA